MLKLGHGRPRSDAQHAAPTHVSVLVASAKARFLYDFSAKGECTNAMGLQALTGHGWPLNPYG